MGGEHVLCSDPLAHVVFDKLRRCGPDRTDGQTIRVDGNEYGISAHTVCTLRLVHVVTECLGDPGTGHQRAMAVLEIEQNGYQGMAGAVHLMPALVDGLVIFDPLCPDRHSWRVLPWVEVPHCFKPGEVEVDHAPTQNQKA